MAGLDFSFSKIFCDWALLAVMVAALVVDEWQQILGGSREGSTVENVDFRK